MYDDSVGIVIQKKIMRILIAVVVIKSHFISHIVFIVVAASRDHPSFTVFFCTNIISTIEFVSSP